MQPAGRQRPCCVATYDGVIENHSDGGEQYTQGEYPVLILCVFSVDNPFTPGFRENLAIVQWFEYVHSEGCKSHKNAPGIPYVFVGDYLSIMPLSSLLRPVRVIPNLNPDSPLAGRRHCTEAGLAGQRRPTFMCGMDPLL